MKQPKKLTRNLKIKMNKKGFNPELYRLKTETADSYILEKKEPDGKNDTVTLHK